MLNQCCCIGVNHICVKVTGESYSKLQTFLNRYLRNKLEYGGGLMWYPTLNPEKQPKTNIQTNEEEKMEMDWAHPDTKWSIDCEEDSWMEHARLEEAWKTLNNINMEEICVPALPTVNKIWHKTEELGQETGCNGGYFRSPYVSFGIKGLKDKYKKYLIAFKQLNLNGKMYKCKVLIKQSFGICTTFRLLYKVWLRQKIWQDRHY